MREAVVQLTGKGSNNHRHGDVYYIAASPSFRSRACCWRYVESKGARMKAIVSGILGVGLGALGVWLYTSNIANDSDKIGTEISIENTIKQIELLKANKHSELEAALISSLPCQIQIYEELISANSEASATFSNKLIAQAKQYSGEKSCPN
jgi:hypothetical protein